MDTLYLKLPQKCTVTAEKLILGDIAEITCSNLGIENRAKAILLKRFAKNKKQRAIFSVNTLISEIDGVAPGVNIVPLGEVDTVVDYVPKLRAKFAEMLLVFLVCVIAFFGAAFTIMTFNTDVDTGKLFQDLYMQLTGTASDGFTVIELFYSIGLPLGILVFFNHFSGHKLTNDPTPLEVQMAEYEYTVNKSLLAENTRKETSAHARKSVSGTDRTD